MLYYNIINASFIISFNKSIIHSLICIVFLNVDRKFVIFFLKSIKYLYIVAANCPVSQLEISPLIALLNMIKDNYFDRPQVFQTLIAVLHDYNHNFNSASKVSNLMAFILLKSL